MTDLEELCAAYDVATGGEWERQGAYLVRSADGSKIAQSLGYVGVREEQSNLKFMALAHNNMPALLEAVEALENNGQVFERDKESHKAWTLARAALENLK